MVNTWEWLLTEDLYTTVLTPADDPESKRVLVTDTGRRWAVIVTVTNSAVTLGSQVVMLNGIPEDLGDSYPQILGLVDEAYELGSGEQFLDAVF